MYDCSCERSFASVKEWINIINETTDKRIPIVIVANKIDLRDEVRKSASRVIEREEGAKLAAEFECLFLEASAKDGTNMDESLIELCRYRREKNKFKVVFKTTFKQIYFLIVCL